MELHHIKGLGPHKIQSLHDRGIRTVEDLASLDLDQHINFPGITPENLKTLVHRACELTPAKQEPIKTPSTEPSKRNWLSRLLRKSPTN